MRSKYSDIIAPFANHYHFFDVTKSMFRIEKMKKSTVFPTKSGYCGMRRARRGTKPVSASWINKGGLWTLRIFLCIYIKTPATNISTVQPTS